MALLICIAIIINYKTEKNMSFFLFFTFQRHIFKMTDWLLAISTTQLINVPFKDMDWANGLE